MKKKILFVLVLFMFAICSCNSVQTSVERHVYTDEEISSFLTYGQGDMRIYQPGLKSNVALSSLIVEGSVQTDGEEQVYTEAGIYSDYITVYEIMVEETWFGKVSEKRINVALPGRKDEFVTKPHIGDKIVIFLSETPAEYDYYVPADLIGSIYVLNPPDDKILALTGNKIHQEYNGEDIVSFRDSVNRTLEEIVDNETDVPYRTEEIDKYIKRSKLFS